MSRRDINRTPQVLEIGENRCEIIKFGRKSKYDKAEYIHPFPLVTTQVF